MALKSSKMSILEIFTEIKADAYTPCLGRSMGRTVIPFSFVLEEERERWKPFRKGLSKEDQQVFDPLFDRAKFHTHASVYVAHAWPLETILLSICLEHEKMFGEIPRDAQKSECIEIQDQYTEEQNTSFGF